MVRSTCPTHEQLAYAQVKFFERPPDLAEFGRVVHGTPPVLHRAAPLSEKERRQIIAVPLRACACVTQGGGESIFQGLICRYNTLSMAS